MSKEVKRRLNDDRIERIVGVLDGWSGKLTWALFIEEITPIVGKYSRQALEKHVRIKQAFQHRKDELRCKDPDSPARTVAEQKSLDRIARLEGEVSRLKMENEQLLEQFLRWAYNAHKKGIGKEVLDQPLPAVDREQTKL